MKTNLYRIHILTVLCCFILISCNTKSNSLVSKLEQACASNDQTQIESIRAEIEAYGTENFSPEQKEKMSFAISDYNYRMAEIEQQEAEREQQKRNEALVEKLCSSNWKCVIAGNVLSQCLLNVVTFTENGLMCLTVKRYVGGNLLSESSGDESLPYYLSNGEVYIDGDFEFYFDGSSLVDKRGNSYERGSYLQY